MNQINLNKIVYYKNIVLKLKILESITKGHHPNNYNKENILDYLKFPHFLPFDKLKEEIYLIFNAKNNDELYDNFISELQYVFNKDKIIKNRDEENSLKVNIYKVLKALNYFISKSLIFIDNKNQFDKAFAIFKIFIQTNIDSKSILFSYINIFDLFSFLKDYYSINRESILSIQGTKKILYLIDILRLQNIFSFRNIFYGKKLLILNRNSLIFELYLTYNTSLKELNDLPNFTLQHKRIYYQHL